jgi:hypothetical protein
MADVIQFRDWAAKPTPPERTGPAALIVLPVVRVERQIPKRRQSKEDA